MNDADVTIREARREDCQAIMVMSKEIADFHQDYDHPQIHFKVLERDLFDAADSNIGVYVAEHGGELIGYAHYFYTCDVRRGRGMCLEDLYVKERFRDRRVGDRLMRAVAKKAAEQSLHKIELVVADWNRAANFYKRRGAVDRSETEKLRWFIIDKSGIERIASAR